MEEIEVRVSGRWTQSWTLMGKEWGRRLSGDCVELTATGTFLGYKCSRKGKKSKEGFCYSQVGEDGKPDRSSRSLWYLFQVWENHKRTLSWDVEGWMLGRGFWAALCSRVPGISQQHQQWVKRLVISLDEKDWGWNWVVRTELLKLVRISISLKAELIGCASGRGEWILWWNERLMGKNKGEWEFLQPPEAEYSGIGRTWLPGRRELTYHISSKKPVHTSSIPPVVIWMLLAPIVS